MAETQETRIQVIFRVDTPHGAYQDALWFTKEEYDKVTQEEIDIKKQERVDNWIKIVSTPSVEPTKEEKMKQIQDQIDNFTERIQNLQEEKAKVK